MDNKPKDINRPDEYSAKQFDKARPDQLNVKPVNNEQIPNQIYQQDIVPGSVMQQSLVSGGNAKGDMYIGKDGLRFDRVPIGTTGQVLGIKNGVPVWYENIWTDVSLWNNWVNDPSKFNKAGYFKDAMGWVHLRGYITSGTIDGVNPAFVVPPDCFSKMEYTFCTISNNAIARIDIITDGRVIVSTGDNTWVSLDGISYSTF
jgi:hypothetical protein